MQRGLLLLVVTALISSAVAGALQPASNNTDCRAWLPNTAQHVTVAPDVGTLFLGSKCNAALQHINITFLCYPGASIRIDHWHMVGGFVRVAGPPAAPWSLFSVTVVVTASLIAALEGPAVGIELGYGWPNTTAASFTANAVTLVASQSTLSSVATASAATVLGCGSPIDELTRAPFNVSIISCVFAASNSTLAATIESGAAIVVGAAFTYVSSVFVDRCQFIVVRSSAVTSSMTRTGSFAVAAISGVASGNATVVVVNNSLQYVWLSNVSIINTISSTSGSTSYGVSTLGGVTVGYFTNAVVVVNSSQYVSWVNATCTSLNFFGNANGFTAVSVGGVAVGSLGAVTIATAVQYVVSTNVTLRSDGGSASSTTCTATSIGGVAVGSASSVAVNSTMQYVSRTVAISNTSSGDSHAFWSFAASSVGGVSLGDVYYATIDSTTQCVLWTNANNVVSSVATDAFVASSVGAVAIGNTNYITLNNITEYVSWTNATSSSSGNGGATAHGASSIGGFAVGNTNFGPIMINNIMQYFALNTAITKSSCLGVNSAYMASSSAGVAAGSAQKGLSIDNITQYVTSTSLTTDSSIISATAAASSTSGGVAIGTSNNAITIRNATQLLLWTNANCTSNTTAGSSSTATSSVAGVAIGYTSNAVEVTNSAQYVSQSNATGSSSSSGNAVSSVGGVSPSLTSLIQQTNRVLSMSSTRACATGVSHNVTCSDFTSGTTACCTNVSTTVFAVPIVTVGIPFALLPSISDGLWIGGGSANPTRTLTFNTTTTTSRSRSKSTPRHVTSSSTLSRTFTSLTMPSFTVGSSSSPTLMATLSFALSSTATTERTQSSSQSLSRQVNESATHGVTQTGPVSSSVTPTRTIHFASVTPNLTPSITATIAVQAAADASVGILPVAVVVGSQGFVSTTTAVAATLTGPGAALQASRAMTVVALSTCNSDPDARVPFPLSVWPGFQLDATRRGAFLRGAVVAGCASMSIVVCLAATIAVIIQIRRKTTFLAAASVVKYPGWLTVPIGLTVDGVVASGLASFLWGGALALDRMVGVFAVAYVAAALFFIIGISYHVSLSVASMERVAVTNTTESDTRSQQRTDCRTRLERFVRGDEWWVPKETSSVAYRAVGAVFNKYRHRWRWYYAFDLTLTVIVSCVKGTMPSSRSSCTVAIIVVSMVCAVSFVTAVAWKPYISPAKQWLFVLTSALTFCAVLLVLIGQLASESGIISAGQVAAMLAGYLAVGNVVIGVYRELSDFSQRRQRTEKRQTFFLMKNEPSAEMIDVTAVTVLPEPVDSVTVFDDDVRQRTDDESPLLAAGTILQGSEHEMTLRQGAALRRAYTRSHEGQMLYDELEQLLGHAPVLASPRIVVERNNGRAEQDDALDAFL